MTFIATRRGTQSRLWLPRDLGVSLSAWYDGSDPTTITGTTSISQWRDKSANGNHLVQPSGGFQPSYAVTDAPYNTNTTGVLHTSSSAPSIPIGTSDRSVFMCSNMFSGRDGYSQFTFQYGGTSGTSGFGFSAYTTGTNGATGDSNSKNFEVYNGGSYVGPGPGVKPSLYNTTQIISILCANQNLVINSNGAQAYSGALSYNTTSGYLFVFNSSFGNVALQGHLYDLIILQKTSPSTTALVEGYLAWKRGLVGNLPVSHPYKLRPPTVAA